MLNGIELPIHWNFIYWPSPAAALEQSLKAAWDAASWPAILILPQIKLNSQLSKKKKKKKVFYFLNIKSMDMIQKPKGKRKIFSDK